VTKSIFSPVALLYPKLFYKRKAVIFGMDQELQAYLGRNLLGLHTAISANVSMLS
jgi:hypothetical protein